MAGGLIVTGLSSAIGGLRKRAEDDIRKTHEIIIGAAQILLQYTLPFVPVKEGDLRATGRVEGVSRGFSSEAEVVFGGVAPSGRVVDYAWVVHERDDLGHAPPTGSKFLIRGMRQAMPFMKRWVGAAFTHDAYPLGVFGEGSAAVWA